LVVVKPRFALSVTKADGKEIVAAGVTSATVRMDRDLPADECRLVFPERKEFTLDVFTEGDEVSLALGHAEFGVFPLFRGPITRIEPNKPLTVVVENRSYGSRRSRYVATYQDKTWGEIATDAFERAGLHAVVSGTPPATKPPRTFRVDNLTPAQVLDQCARQTCWVWYVLPGTDDGWFGPRPEEPPRSDERRWVLEVGGNAFADDCRLEYGTSHGVKRVCVTLADAECQKPPATGEFKAPDYKDGDAEKRFTRCVADPTAAQAEALAEAEYHRLAPPFRGTLAAIGNPLVYPGVRVAVKHPQQDDATRYAVVERAVHTFADGWYLMNLNVSGVDDSQR